MKSIAINGIKKVASVLMAAAMVFAMAPYALAETDSGTVTVIVRNKADNEDIASMEVDWYEGMTAKNALDAVDEEQHLELEWGIVENYNPNFDKTAYVISSLDGLATVPVGSASEIPAVYWSEDYPGYGIEYTSEDDTGQTVYHFIYVGKDWTYTVNCCTPVDTSNDYELYMDQCSLNEGDKVEVTYDLQITRWEDTENWMAE